jgi:nitronate monooxygenase
MWSDTQISKRLGIAYPIMQGPFGCGLSSARLAATISNAGGLGCYGANTLAPAQIKDIAAEIRAQTAHPFALHLWVDHGAAPTLGRDQFERMRSWFVPYYRELGIAPPAFPKQIGQDYGAQVEAMLAARPHVFSFAFGAPSPEILRECRTRAIVTIGTATTVDEARALEAADVDAIVAMGLEAGGHAGSFLHASEKMLIGSLALLPQVVDAVKLPVIAAGGIADARGIVAALALGAQAVQIGTAFLACEQSGAPLEHRDKLFSDAAKETALSRVFSGRLARGIRNRLMDEMTARVTDPPPYPVQSWFTNTFRKAAIERGRSDLILLEAGQIAPLIRHRDAAALMAELVRETPRILARLSR